MVQAPGLDGLTLYLLALLQDLLHPAMISVDGCDIAEALMIAAVIVILDEGGDMLLKITGR